MATQLTIKCFIVKQVETKILNEIFLTYQLHFKQIVVILIFKTFIYKTVVFICKTCLINFF